MDTSQPAIATLYRGDDLCQNISFAGGKSMDDLAYVRLYSAEQGSYMLYNLKVVEACTTTVTEDYLVADVIGAEDYYPGGMIMPGRNFTGSEGYRFAFQGQEHDNEPGTEHDYFQLRIWDGRLGRWTSTDPYNQFHSSYLGMGNNPISGVDMDGGFWRQLTNFFKGHGWHNIEYARFFGDYGLGNVDWSLFRSAGSHLAALGTA